MTVEDQAVAAVNMDSRKAVFHAANVAEAKKAFASVILDTREVTLLADFFLITGADNAAQVRAIADAIDESLSKFGYQPRSIEGKKEGRWVLLDYGDIIVHILQEKDRSFYKLEQFWNHALVVDRKQWAQD